MVCFDTPISRPTSAADRPASICFSAPIISTSLYFLFVMPPPLRKFPSTQLAPGEAQKSYLSVRGKWGEGQARGYVYFGGQRIAEYGNSTTYFAHNDHLGSPRLFTDVTAAYTTDCYDFLPFGERNLPTTPCRSSSPPSPPQAN